MHKLSTQEAQLVEQIAQKINRFGLKLPLLFMLDAGQPLSFIGGQLLWVAQPALSLFVPSQQVRQWAQLLENPSAIRSLKQQLKRASG